MMNRLRSGEIAGWLFALVGFSFCVLSFFDPAFDVVNSVLIPGAAPADSTSRMYALVMGSVMCGFGVATALAVRVPDGARVEVRRAVLAGFLTWFVVDSTGSILHGAIPNVIFNLLSVVVLLPMLMSVVRDRSA